MRLPFLRSSPAARSTSKIPKRRILLAGLLGGVDTAPGSLASANFLSPRTVWGRVEACPERSPKASVEAERSPAGLFAVRHDLPNWRHLCRGVAAAWAGRRRVPTGYKVAPSEPALQCSGVCRQPTAGSASPKTPHA